MEIDSAIVLISFTAPSISFVSYRGFCSQIASCLKSVGTLIGGAFEFGGR
jgi:hypothetical protein